MTDQSQPGNQRTETNATLRPLLFSIAYRMVGSVTEAEDLVQETFLRIHDAEQHGTEIESRRAYACSVITRLSIDHLRSARVRREQYVGEWLPEPIVTDRTLDPAQHAELSDSLSMAFLVLLERLSPPERAVFLLRDVFGYGFDEIAELIGKSEDNCRQLAVRARRRVQEGQPRFETSIEKRWALAERFFALSSRATPMVWSISSPQTPPCTAMEVAGPRPGVPRSRVPPPPPASSSTSGAGPDPRR